MGEDIDIQKMMAEMNRHIPAVRRTLLDYIENGDLTYRTKDGFVCDLGGDEIDYLRDICTEIEKPRLKLPIYVSTDVAGETSAWKVDGILESRIVARILGKKQYRDDSIRFYYPDLQLLRRRLPTAIVVVYL